MATDSALAVLGPANAVPPSISGSAVQGSTLTCTPGTWVPTPTGYSYSWQRNVTTTIGGASNQYTLTAADVGQSITCTVVAYDSLGSSLPAVSVPPVIPVALPVAAVPVETSLPAITGSALEGQAVTCSPGSWENSPTSYAYSWQRDATNIAGQTGSQYVLSAADVGQSITCTVVASNASGSSAPAISLPILPTAEFGAASGPAGSSGGSGGSSSSGGGGSGSGKTGGRTPARPWVMSLSVAPRKMVVSVRGRRQQTNGVTFIYRLNQTATVRIAIQRRFNGTLVGRRCVAHPRIRGRKKGRRCTAYATVATIAVKNASASLDRLRYAGRVGRSLLPSGSYRTVIAASNAGGWSNLRSAGFAVVRKKVVVRRTRRHSLRRL